MNESLHFTNPLQTEGEAVLLGDPYILQHEGFYYLFGTTDWKDKKHFKAWISKDFQNWESIGYTLHLNENAWSKGTFWAPEVIEYKGRFYMNYTATNPKSEGYKLCLAVADHPWGPYKEYAAPLFDDQRRNWDSHIFLDQAEDGSTKLYLFFTSEKESWGAELTTDLRSLKTDLKKLTEVDQGWEMPEEPEEARKFWCNEGPFVFKKGKAYFMTYSANHWASELYAIGYATAKHPLGPWEKYENNPILESDFSVPVSGPGHNSFVLSPDGSERWMIYHSHINGKPGRTRVVNAQKVKTEDMQLKVIGSIHDKQRIPSGLNPELSYPKVIQQKIKTEKKKLALEKTEDAVKKAFKTLPIVYAASAYEERLSFENALSTSVFLEAFISLKSSDDTILEEEKLSLKIKANSSENYSLKIGSEQSKLARSISIDYSLHQPKLFVFKAKAFKEKTLTMPVAKSLNLSTKKNPSYTLNDDIRFHLNWESDGLYIPVRVNKTELITDSEKSYENDSVELYLDLRRESEREDGYSKGVFQTAIIAGSEKSSVFPRRFALEGVTAVTEVDEDGYTARFFVPAELIKEKDLSKINFDIAVNFISSDDGKVQREQVFFSGYGNNWKDTRYFAELKLK